jgi:hypothetical protein
LAGPLILEYFVKSKFDKRVELNGLRITPQLGLRVKRLDFNKLYSLNSQPIDASVKALSLDWSGLLSLKPVLNLSLGSVAVEGLGNIQGANLEFEAPYFPSLGQLNLLVRVDGIISSEDISVGTTEMSGTLNTSTLVFSDVKFSGNKIKIEGDFTLNSSAFTGSLGKLNSLQLNSKDFTSLEVDLHDLNFSTGKDKYLSEFMDLSVNFNDDFKEIMLVGNAVDDISGKTVASGLSASIILDTFNPNSWRQINFFFEKLTLPDSSYYTSETYISKASSVLNKSSENTINLKSSGRLMDFEIKSQDQFIADLSRSAFEISSKISNPADDKLKVYSVGELKTDTSPLINVKGELFFDLDEQGFFQCVDKNCVPLNVDTKYEIIVADAVLRGESHCENLSCRDGNFSHSIKTEDTQEFFNGLNLTKVFNPFLLGLLYGSFSSGNKIGNGHILEF